MSNVYIAEVLNLPEWHDSVDIPNKTTYTNISPQGLSYYGH